MLTAASFSGADLLRSALLLSAAVVPIVSIGALVFWRRRWLSKIQRLEHDYEHLSDEIWELRAASEARDRAEAASEAKSRFLATVSHEIRTPLNGIVGMADLLRATALDAEQQSYVAAVRTSGTALTSLIDEILDFSRIEAGRLDLANEPFDLTALVEGVMELLGPRAQDRGLEIAAMVARNLPRWVVGDGPRLRQVLTNLAGNAVKFTEHGGVGLRVERDGTWMRFSVSDTGPGVPSDRRTAIFAEFEQADNSTTRRHGGTGLGLAISSRIISRMGGELTLDDRSGGGSVFAFSVFLPPARMADRLNQGASWPSLSGQNALIISPSIFQARFLAEELFVSGARTRQVAEGQDGLALLRSPGFPVDLLFVDCSLGESDAEALIAEAQSQGIARTILLFSPFERRAFGQRLISQCDGWLVKPVRSISLAERVSLRGTVEREPEPETAPPVPLPLPPSQGTAMVLLAEDNAINALIARKSLERFGSTVVHATDGHAALDLASQAVMGLRAPFDLILMDVSMPGLDGLEVTRRLRDLENRRGASPTRIVALTAHALHDNQLECRLAGMDDVLTKPVDPARFKRLLDEPAFLAAS